MKTLVGGCAAHCCCRVDNNDNAKANQKAGLHASLGYEGYDSWDEYGNITIPYDVVVTPKPKN